MLILISLLAFGALAFAWLAFRDPDRLWDLQRAGYRLEGVEARPGPGWAWRQKLSAVLFLAMMVFWIGRYASLSRATEQRFDRVNQALEQFPRSTPTVFVPANLRYGH